MFLDHLRHFCPLSVAVWAFFGIAAAQTAQHVNVFPDAVTSISIIQGSGQSVTVATAFPTLLAVSAAPGTSVTFTAPATPSATGLFSGALSSVTVIANSSGVAQAPVFTANSYAGTYNVIASAPGAAAVTFSLTNVPGEAARISVYTGSGQSAPINQSFSQPLVVMVTDAHGNPVPGAGVTCLTPTTGASATFPVGSHTTVAATDSDGFVYCAPPTANGTVGTYNAIASLNDPAIATSFSLANISAFLQVALSHAGTFSRGQQNATYTVYVSNEFQTNPPNGTVTVEDDVPAGLTLTSMSGSGWTCPGTAPNNCTRNDAPGNGLYPPITIVVNVAPDAPFSITNVVRASAANSPTAVGSDLAMLTGAAGPLGFYPLRPCRLVDTRPSQGKNSPFGGPALDASTIRDFPVMSAGCGFLNSLYTTAYSLNFTVVPPGPLSYLSTWPSGSPYPGVSTLNSTDGSTLANAAIVSAGANGDISVMAGNSTDLIIDTNGFFGPPTDLDFAFYLVTPCRVADTRTTQPFTGDFGPPALAANSTRNFPILSSSCNIPNNARAYSLNFTAIPQGPLPYLSTWPSDQSYPGVSTLNSPDGSTIANAAIVPAAIDGEIAVSSAGATDLIIDVNGYYASKGSPGALRFYTVPPCRVADTREGHGFTGAFGPPGMTASTTRDFPIPYGGCGIPFTAQAYSLNVTAVPHGALPYLSVWPTGEPYPNVSTLNSPKGTTLANAAIVPAGANGAVTVLTGGATDLIIDINGYFAP